MIRPADRHVFFPLEELWDDQGSFGRRLRYLDCADLSALLADGPVRFVEADIGKPFRWIPEEERFRYWKSVKANIAETDTFHLQDFPDEYVFVASEWEGRGAERLIVLEIHH